MAAVSALLWTGQVLLWLGIGLVGLLAVLVLALLLLPLDLRGRFDDSGEKTPWLMKLAWGWLAVQVQVWGDGFSFGGVEVRFFGRRLSQRARSAKKAGPRKRPQFDGELIRALLTEGGKAARWLHRHARLHVEGDLRFGFEDPSYTGLACAALGLIGPFGPVKLQPDFVAPGLGGWLHLKSRLFGYEIGWAALVFFWRLPLRHRWWRRLQQRLNLA